MNKLNNTFSKKVIISGKVLDLYEYEKPIVKHAHKQKIGRYGEQYTSEETKKENRKKCAVRSRRNIIQLINANFDNTSKFITLTFAENIQNIDTANKLFKEFIQRLNYYLGITIDYLAVIEFQTRGAIHYHLLANIPYIKNKTLAEIWRNGFVKINLIDSVDNVGAYVSKYMTKDTENEKLIGKKKYLHSKKLKKPIEVHNNYIIDKILSDMPPIKRIDSQEYKSEYNGTITHIQIILEEKFPKSIIDIMFGRLLRRITMQEVRDFELPFPTRVQG